VSLVEQFFAEELGEFNAGPDSTGIITDRHLDRLLAMVSQARDAGYEVVQPEPGATVDRATRRMPFTMVVEAGDELDVMREELFGPVLPILAYDDVDEVIARVNAGERPLGLYVYTDDMGLAEQVANQTSSGAVGVNVSLLQGALVPLAFGGVGNSGMGRHHGIEGFKEFSYPRGFISRGDAPDVIDMVNPPYRQLEALIDGAFGAAAGEPTA
jgi:coniferyl-aldehyde dehydrogenase